MKEHRFYVLLMIFMTYSVIGQVKGNVVDENDLPIPYVNIWVENEEVGTTSDKDGIFEISATNKNLVFSAIGYETKIVNYSECKKVILIENIYQLNEVIVLNPKRDEQITVGNFNKDNTSSGLGCSKNNPVIIAKYFSSTENIQKHPFLKEINFNAYSIVKEARMILHFYNVNEDGSPGEELSDKNYYVFLKKGTKLSKINVEKMNIIFPENGIFIGFEWLIIKENEYINKKNAKLIMPILTVNLTETTSTWQKKANKWELEKQVKSKDKNINDKLFLDLAINLILTN